MQRYDARITANDTAIKAEVERATAAEATKAPTSHASETTAYGAGNGTNYGHVRLAVASTPATSDATAGIAATPKVVNDAVAAASNTINTAIDNVKGDVANLEARIDKGESIGSFYVIGDSYLEGYNPGGDVSGFGNRIKTALKIPVYNEDAQGGAKWDSSTPTHITADLLNYEHRGRVAVCGFYAQQAGDVGLQRQSVLVLYACDCEIHVSENA